MFISWVISLWSLGFKFKIMYEDIKTTNFKMLKTSWIRWSSNASSIVVWSIEHRHLLNQSNLLDSAKRIKRYKIILGFSDLMIGLFNTHYVVSLGWWKRSDLFVPFHSLHSFKIKEPLERLSEVVLKKKSASCVSIALGSFWHRCVQQTQSSLKAQLWCF